MWQGLSGHWDGTWTNHTFASSGDLAADVKINPDCTAEATIDGIFMQPGPQTVHAIYHDGPATLIEVQNDPIFGDATITIAANGALTLTGTGLHQSIESVTGTGNVSATQVDLDIELTFTGGGSAEETIELTREVTPTPTPTPTPEATPTPTPTFLLTPSPAVLVQGDVDCSAAVDSVDALKTLRFVASLTVSQGPNCPLIGAEVASLWGDVDCSGSADSVDALKILRHVALLTVQQVGDCPDIGTPVGG